MRIALTGGTGFLGRYVAAELLHRGFEVRALCRSTSDRSGLESGPIDWVEGSLGDPDSLRSLVEGADGVIHAALDRPGDAFDLDDEEGGMEAVEANLIGSIRLMETSKRAGIGRFVLISSGAVHDVILPDRPLDETHPSWPKTHYGATKSALEAFVHSYGLGGKLGACALRPTAIYGLARPAEESRWYDLIARVARGEDVECRKGAKVVHARDVARASTFLLGVPGVEGQAYHCVDRYVSDFEVATIAQELTGSVSEITGEPTSTKNPIDSAKLKDLGMQFGGLPLLRETIEEILGQITG